MKVKFYESVDDSLLKFAVIISTSNGKWVLCKHKDRNTYEVPGGHRETGETILETAKRELYEETGAINYEIKSVCVYSVVGNDNGIENVNETFGMLFYADISEFNNELHSEIEKIDLFDDLQGIKWTYPLIQPELIEKFLKSKTIDIYGEIYCEKHSHFREACRGIVIRGENILLSYEANADQWMIPGGGIENNESHFECCIRELNEETGYIVQPKRHYLTINEHYRDWLFSSHYYICECVGETEKRLTEEEIKNGLTPKWISLNEAIDIFSKYQDYCNDENKMKIGLYLREYKALSYFLKNKYSIYWIDQ